EARPPQVCRLVRRGGGLPHLEDLDHLVLDQVRSRCHDEAQYHLDDRLSGGGNHNAREGQDASERHKLVDGTIQRGRDQVAGNNTSDGAEAIPNPVVDLYVHGLTDQLSQDAGEYDTGEPVVYGCELALEVP